MRRCMILSLCAMLILLALVATGVLGRPLSTVTQAAFNKLFIFAEWGYML